jgi:pyruvate dehydrogenase E2 component (dihydrolipoamide acetyltransferase)
VHAHAHPLLGGPFSLTAERLAGCRHLYSAQDVVVGENVAIVVEDQADVAAFKDYVAGGAAAPAAPAAAAPAATEPTAAATAPPAPPAAAAAATAAPPPPPSAAPVGSVAPASPYARALAAGQGLSLEGLLGTGPGGRIIAADVMEAAAGGGRAPAPPPPPPPPPPPGGAAAAAPAGGATVPDGAAFVDIPNSNIKKVTAKRMVESKTQVPHYYLTIEVEMDALMSLRSQVNAAQDTKTSVNDYVIKACALALKEVPECNASWTDEYVRQYSAADVSVAVNTDRGLITPIVFDACTKGVTDIATDVRALAGKARDGKLQPHEFIGGTFTVSNLGMYGLKQFTAIINSPQACILAVGGTEKKVVPNEGPDSDANPFVVKSTMLVSLSADHRVVDGAIGAQWLQAFKKHIESPLLLLL